MTIETLKSLILYVLRSEMKDLEYSSDDDDPFYDGQVSGYELAIGVVERVFNNLESEV